MMRRTRRTSSASKPASKDDGKIDSWFEEYRDKDEDVIGPEGVERFCNDLELDPADRKVLLLAWKMGAERMGFFTRDEFHRGMSALKVSSTDKLKKTLPSLEDELAHPANYKDFYQYAFKFCLTEPRQRIIDIDTAVTMLQLTMPASEKHLQPFCEYLQEQTEYKSINLDQWMSFFRFCQEVTADCSNYDESSAWPLLLDNYVEWHTAKR